MFKLRFPWKGKKVEETPLEEEEKEVKVDFDRLIYEKIVSLRADYRILESYPLVDPWARALILERKVDGSLLYFVDEIPLTTEERQLYEKVMDILYWELEPPPSGEDPREHFKKQVSKIIRKFRLRFSSSIHPGISWQKIEYYINRDSIEYGPITPLMKDPAIEDISCDGVGRPIYVWHSRYESIPTNIRFDSDEELDDLVVKLAHKAGKHVSVAFPIIDAILPEGHRLAATYKREVSRDGSTFTIRKFKDKPLSIINLVLGGTVSSLLAAYFWKILEFNMTGLIMGVTGAGKTTLLNALATLLRPTIKIVTIEDTPELRLTHENWVQLYSRPSYGFEGGMGEISLYDLVRVSLRYRPDVVIVGEVRGEEAKVLFQAIATGHGGITTIHAEHIDAAVKRLTSPPMEIPKGYIPLVNFAIAIKRVRIPIEPDVYRVERRVTEVWEIQDYDQYILVSRWDPAMKSHNLMLEDSILLPRIAEMTGTSLDAVFEDIERREKIIRWMTYKRLTSYQDVGRVITEYYRRPSKIMSMVERELPRYESYT
ncbi:MAG: type II/IV secretion system ATPase subunit [Desulfurococcales archaeon]|nr:type II/IV secretion system ATPase subunit [Desulfurococcales archaeon]